MRYVSAYLLAVLGGNEHPKEADITKILSSVGIDADKECVKKVVGELSGKNLEELMAAGRQKMASMPSAGAAVATTTTTSAPDAGKPEPAKEAKKEEKKEESEEEDGDMGFGLFD